MGTFLRRLIKTKEGSLTVEAAIALPIFMCAFLSIIYFIKVINIQNNVQYALNGAANELATYSYLYSVSGLQHANDTLNDNIEQNGQLASDHAAKILEAFDALGENLQSAKNSTGQLLEGDTSQIETLEELYDKSKSSPKDVQEVFKDIRSNPKKEFISIASLFASSGFVKVKGELSKPLIRLFMRKYADIKIFNSKRGPGAYIEVKEGQDPFEIFDLNKSRIFVDNKTIDIVVRYKIKTALPINFLPEITMEQRATVRAWLDGDGSGKKEEGESGSDSQKSLWDESPFDYGTIITQEELKSYPDRYPKSGDAYEVRSINLDANSYKDLNKVKYTAKNSINKFFDKTSKDKGINSRTLIIVVPEGTLSEEVKKLFEELKAQANAMNPPVNVIYKEGYGRQSQSTEAGEPEEDIKPIPETIDTGPNST
jgi:hypothetical protein